MVKKEWTEQAFLEEAAKRHPSSQVAIAKEIIDWADSSRAMIKPGEGPIDPSLAIVLPNPGGVAIKLLVLNSYREGDIHAEIQFEYLKNHHPFTNTSLRSELMQRLRKIDGVGGEWSNDRIETRPALSLLHLEQEDQLERFLGIMDWVIKRIRGR